MIELKQITRTFRDGRAGYEVTIDRKYTVKEFINEVISNKNEWGYIGIKRGRAFTILGDPSCEYKLGELLSNLPEDYLDKEISFVYASGGWSRMDYLITTI